MTARESAVDQTLHGYRDGHRLLAASTDLDGADRRLMLLLSDSSDAKRISASEPLFSGYPLPSGKYYVLAMTWAAPEVKRPGCVWTHSLLLPAPVLEFSDLASLLSAFKRPQDEDDWDAYSRGLSIQDRSPKGGALFSTLPTVLWSLYDPPAPPVDLRDTALADADRHAFLMNVWAQQWSALRRTFAFGESPRIARRIDGALIDLQVTHSPQRSSWEEPHNKPKPRTVTRALDSPVPHWCDALADDIRQPSGLREFLAEFGPTVRPTRESLWALTCVWVALDPAIKDVGLSTALAAIARAFPDPEEGVDLKRAVLGEDHRRSLPHPINEEELLPALIESDLMSFAAGGGLDGRRLIEQLFARDERVVLNAVKRIKEEKRTRAARYFLVSLGAVISEGNLSRWAKDDPETVAFLARQSPELALKPALWANMPFEVLWPGPARASAAKAKRQEMLIAMLKAKAGTFVDAAVKDWPDGAEMLLGAINSEDLALPSGDILQDLPDKVVLAWLTDHGPAPRVAAGLLQAWSSKRLAKVPVEEWDALQEMGVRLTDFTLAQLFLAATDPDTNLGPERAVAAYCELVERIPKGLKKKASRLLDDALPKSGNRNQGAAERLATAFVVGKWPIHDIFAIADADSFKAVLEADSSLLSEKILPALAEVEVSTVQRNAVRDAVEGIEDASALKKAVKTLLRIVGF